MTENDVAYLATVGLRIRLYRIALGESQDAFARRAGVSRVTLGAIERGEHGAGILTYRTLAAGLGRDIGELLSEGEVLP